MKQLTLVAIFLLQASYCLSQTHIGKITGDVSNEKKAAVEFATVILAMKIRK